MSQVKEPLDFSFHGILCQNPLIILSVLLYRSSVYVKDNLPFVSRVTFSLAAFLLISVVFISFFMWTFKNNCPLRVYSLE